jgi:hypothetical protein
MYRVAASQGRDGKRRRERIEEGSEEASSSSTTAFAIGRW